MGRQNAVVVFGLVFLAVLGLAAAASAPSASPSKSPAAPQTDVEAPVSEDTIGTTDGDAAASPGDDGDVAVAGPLGSDSSYGSNGPSPSTAADSGVAALGVSAVFVGVASIAGSFLFL